MSTMLHFYRANCYIKTHNRVITFEVDVEAPTAIEAKKIARQRWTRPEHPFDLRVTRWTRGWFPRPLYCEVWTSDTKMLYDATDLATIATMTDHKGGK